MSNDVQDLELLDLFKKADSGDIALISELGTRDESKQSRKFVPRLEKLKTVCGLNHRVLAMKDLVLPFDPFSVTKTNEFNEKKPFRPILLVSQAIELIKLACIEKPSLADKYETLLGGKFSSGKTASKEDYFLFKAKGYIKPRIMTYYTVTVNMDYPGIPSYKSKYTVDPTKLNDDMSYDYEFAPVHHQLAMLFNSILKAEWNEKEQLLKNSGASEEQKIAERRLIFSKSPIGFVTPTNLIPFLFFPLNEEFPTLDSNDYLSLEEYIKFYSFTDKWLQAFSDIDKDNSYDENIDFFDFTLKTPESGSLTAKGKALTDDDPNAIYQALTIQITDGRNAIGSGKIKNKSASSAFTPIWNLAKLYFLKSQEAQFNPEEKSFETLMAISTKFKPIEVISDLLLPASLHVFENIFKNSPYFTERVKKANAEILIAMDPTNVALTVNYEQHELNNSKEEQSIDMQSIIKISQEESTVQNIGTFSESNKE